MKKIILFIVCIVISLSIFTACTNENDTTIQSEEQQQQTQNGEIKSGQDLIDEISENVKGVFE